MTRKTYLVKYQYDNVFKETKYHVNVHIFNKRL